MRKTQERKKVTTRITRARAAEIKESLEAARLAKASFEAARLTLEIASVTKEVDVLQRQILLMLAERVTGENVVEFRSVLEALCQMAATLRKQRNAGIPLRDNSSGEERYAAKVPL